MLSQSVSPALKQHMEAQLSFFTELSRKMLDSTQKIMELHLNLAQELIEESNRSSHQLMQAKDASEFASLITSQIQPTTEKLRNFQQHLSSLVAGTHMELTKTAETHMPEATRTAAAVADEMARHASEETEKASQRQHALMENMSTAAQKGADGAAHGQQGKQTH